MTLVSNTELPPLPSGTRSGPEKPSAYRAEREK
jgi:hypothetical protein